MDLYVEGGGNRRFGVTIVLIGKKGIIYRKNYNLNIFQTAEKGLQVFYETTF